MRGTFDGQSIQGFADYVIIKMTLDCVIESSTLYGDESSEETCDFVARDLGLYVVGEPINENTFVSHIDWDDSLRWQQTFPR